MVTIKEYLCNPEDYDQGLELLKKHSKNRVLLNNLTRKENRDKLLYELGKYTNKPKAVASESKYAQLRVSREKNPAPTNQQTISGKVRIIRKRPPIMYEELPERLQKLWDVNRDLYKETRSLHEKLKLMEKASATDRQPLTKKITANDEQIKLNWAIIDDYKPGEEPEEEPVQEITHKRVNANRKYISTNLTKLSKEKDLDKKSQMAEKIQERVTELVKAGIDISDKTKKQLRTHKIDV